MITKEMSEVEVLAIINDAQEETEANWLAYAENFFYWGMQCDRKNSDEIVRLLENLENSARVGNEIAGAVLGCAILSTYQRVQVVEDGLSYLTKAMRLHIPGAAEFLCNWYDSLVMDDALGDFDDADVGLSDCYDATDGFPRVHLPKSQFECVQRVLETAVCAIKDNGFRGVLTPIIHMFATLSDLQESELQPLDSAILEKAKAQFDGQMVVYAAIRIKKGPQAGANGAALEILEEGVKQNSLQALGTLGTFLVDGVDGVLKADETRGFAYLQQAVAANNDFAKYGLAKCHRDGKGTPVNAEEAKRLMSEAALAEVPPAMAEYGQLLVESATGSEANQDIRRGCDLIRTAAEKYNSPIAWRAILEYHNRKIGPFKTNKFARAAREALKRCALDQR